MGQVHEGGWDLMVVFVLVSVIEAHGSLREKQLLCVEKISGL